MKDDDEFLGFTFKWIITIALALLVVALIYAAASGSLYSLWTRGIHHSIGYVESRNQHAREMILVYKQATDDGQQKATLNDICNTANDLDRAEVARDIWEFLGNHPCGGPTP